MALATRRSIGEEADRIQRLARGTAGHQGADADQPAPLGKERFQRRQQFLRLGHPAGTVFAARHVALVRPHETDAATGERRQVGLRCRVSPHPHVHRRGGDHRLVGGQQHRCRQIVGKAGGHPRQEIGGRRRDEDDVRRAR